MACKFYNLTWGATVPTTYSFIDCDGNTITFIPQNGGYHYAVLADDATPPPPSIDLTIIEDSDLSPILLTNCGCGPNFGGNFLFPTSHITDPLVMTVNQIIFSDGVVLDVYNEFCVTYNSSIIPIFDIVPNISLIRFNNLNLGNSCEECTINNCNYSVTYFIRCCNDCLNVKNPPIECFFGVMNVTGPINKINVYPITVTKQTTICGIYADPELYSPPLNFYNVIIYPEGLFGDPFVDCATCLETTPCIIPTTCGCLDFTLLYVGGESITNLLNPTGIDFYGYEYYNYLNFEIKFNVLAEHWELTDSSVLIATIGNTIDCPVGDWDLVPDQTIVDYVTTHFCPAPTTTTTTTTPEPGCIVVGVSDCNVITLFQMGVECNVSQPTHPESTDGIASLIITGGTPPYTISWSNGGIGPIIYNISAGSYEATVVDYYGDFTANTTCILTGTTTTTSTTSTTTTSPYPNQYELCMVTNMLVQGVYVETQTHFNPSGIYDGKPTWISDDTQQSIIWDNPNSQWKVISVIPTLYVISNLNPTYPPIYGSWFLIGGTGSVIVYEGLCQSLPVGGKLRIGEGITPLTMNVTKNQTICGCDGGITINANGGTPPYTYSIDAGLTYKNMPIFNNLCSGTYNVLVVDNDGIITSSSVILNSPSKPTTYNVSLNTTSKTVGTSNNSVTKQYETTVKITPPLPDGVSLTFDISHLNISKSSPDYRSSTSQSSSDLVINGESIRPSGVGEDMSETKSVIPGCQSNKVYVNSNSEQWNRITIVNTDILSLTTVTSVTKNESINCYIGTSDEKYSITNLKLSGCNCCTVITT